MALTGEEKEMRIPSSLGSYNPLENLDQRQHLQTQEQLIQQDHHNHKLQGTQEHDVPASATATATLNSGRSKSKASLSGSTASRTSYRECRKNHAANIGANVTDGCGEFMPSGEEGTLEALNCAACNCHRNFHRKETQSDAIVVHPLHLQVPPLMIPSPSMNQRSSGSHHWTSMAANAQPVKMAFGGTSAGTDSSSEEMNFNVYHSGGGVPPPPPYVLSKKRFRTKFTGEQKDKMLEFAEKLGWRIPREDDTEVQRFCAEVGVKRQVFKVWMHNNKSASAKKESQDPS